MAVLTAMAYMVTVAVINVGFAELPMWPLPDGGQLPAMAVVAGAVFVVRDYVQQRIGHWVLAVMAAGLALSWWLASPAVALASGVAFMASEVIDWAVFSTVRTSMMRRVVVSSVVAVPVDTVVFLGVAFGMDQVSPLSVIAMSAAKMLPAFAAVAMRRRRG
jgi:queuosine precursor transporter